MTSSASIRRAAFSTRSIPRLGVYSGARWTTSVLLCVALAIPVRAAARAQGTVQKITKAAQSVASFAADIALAKSVTIDAEARGVTPLTIDAIQVGVDKVDVKNGAAVRIHLFYFNPTDQPATIALPGDDYFSLIDLKGRRFQLLSLRAPGVAKGSTQLTVPHLERTSISLVFALEHSTESEALLKVGTTGVIRGIPIRADGTGPRAEATTAPTTGATGTAGGALPPKPPLR